MRHGLYGAVAGPRSGYDPAAADLFLRFTTPPTDDRKGYINNTFVLLRSAGVLPGLDGFWMPAAADAQAGQRNWIADAFNLLPVLGPTHAADQGYTGNGSTQYLDTGLNPTTAGGHFTLNSASAMVWSRKQGTDTGSAIGTLTGQAVSIFPRYSDNVTYCRMNDGTDITKASVTDGRGLTHVNRSASNAKQLYKDGVSVNSLTTASTGLANANLTLLQTGGLFFSGQVAFAAVGGSFNSTEAAAIYAAVNAYLVGVGAA